MASTQTVDPEAVPVLLFEVRGVPQTQGSKRVFTNKQTGRPVMVEAGGQPLRDWRTRVAAAAEDAMCGAPLLAGPVIVSLRFGLPKPASAPKTRRTWPIGQRSGDVDKLARCCLDSMTGVVYGDDSQVVSLLVTKDFGAPGVLVRVAAVTDG